MRKGVLTCEGQTVRSLNRDGNRGEEVNKQICLLSYLSCSGHARSDGLQDICPRLLPSLRLHCFNRVVPRPCPSCSIRRRGGSSGRQTRHWSHEPVRRGRHKGQGYIPIPHTRIGGGGVGDRHQHIEPALADTAEIFRSTGRRFFPRYA